MTLCIGWKERDRVVLVADSAATTATVPDRPSSFRQNQRIRGESVTEAALKLTPVTPWLTAAIAGNPDEAAEFLCHLRSRFESVERPDEAPKRFDALFNSIAQSFEPRRGPRFEFELLLASRGDGEPKLASWHSSSRNLTYHDSAAITGSASRATIDRLTNDIRYVFQRVPAEHRLLALTVCVQAEILWYGLEQENIGGAVFGVETTREDTKWHEDTVYVCFPPAMFEAGSPPSAADPLMLISTRVYGGRGLVRSTDVGNVGLALQHQLDTPNEREDARWYTECALALGNMTINDVRKGRWEHANFDRMMEWRSRYVVCMPLVPGDVAILETSLVQAREADSWFSMSETEFAVSEVLTEKLANCCRTGRPPQLHFVPASITPAVIRRMNDPVARMLVDGIVPTPGRPLFTMPNSRTLLARVPGPRPQAPTRVGVPSRNRRRR